LFLVQLAYIDYVRTEGTFDDRQGRRYAAWIGQRKYIFAHDFPWFQSSAAIRATAESANGPRAAIHDFRAQRNSHPQPVMVPEAGKLSK
jgi:hypothetical protein